MFIEGLTAVVWTMVLTEYIWIYIIQKWDSQDVT
jgi:hypothetical protein